MPRLARVGARDDADPHVVIVGAGGSRAACPHGDRNGHHLPVMADLIDTVGLNPLLEERGIAAVGDFEAFYDDLATSGDDAELVARIDSAVREYFQALRIPETATAYDYLLLSLRPKDLVATFKWDPLLAQAFRRHEGLISMPKLAFLHGNVTIGFCEEHRVVGWYDDSCTTCGRELSPSPLRDKDYESQPALRSQWALLKESMQAAYFVTVFGYSAPVTDAAARDALLRVWSKNETREIAEIELIDIRPEEELVPTWDDFIVGGHYVAGTTIMRAYSSRHPRRSCDALFAATTMNDPWRDDWLPELQDPVELRDWVNSCARGIRLSALTRRRKNWWEPSKTRVGGGRSKETRTR